MNLVSRRAILAATFSLREKDVAGNRWHRGNKRLQEVFLHADKSKGKSFSFHHSVPFKKLKEREKGIGNCDTL